jgi:hypothetical protein
MQGVRHRTAAVAASEVFRIRDAPERSDAGPLRSQVTRSVTPSNNTTYTIVDIRDQYGCAGQTGGSATVTVCKQPDVTITTPASIAAGGTATASVPSTGAGTSYAWTIENGVIESAVNLPVVTFRASCSGTVKLTAKVTSSCSAVNQSTVMIPVTAVSATATGSTTIAQGGSATISAVLTGTGPWSIRWSDQAEATQVMTSPHLRPVSPVGTTTYSVTSVTGAGTCAGTVNGSAVVTVRPPVPTVVSATAISGTQVHVSWQFSGSADRFDVRWS